MVKESKKTALKHEISTISGDISRLRGHVASVIRKLSSFSKSEAGVMRENLMERSKQTLDNVEKEMKKKPLKTVGIALGTGLFVGLLSRLWIRRK